MCSVGTETCVRMQRGKRVKESTATDPSNYLQGKGKSDSRSQRIFDFLSVMFQIFAQKHHILFILFKLLFLFLSTPEAYGRSQAMGRIGAAAEAHATAMATPDLSRIWDLPCSSQQRQILNALIEARDQTHILTERTSGP